MAAEATSADINGNFFKVEITSVNSATKIEGSDLHVSSIEGGGHTAVTRTIRRRSGNRGAQKTGLSESKNITLKMKCHEGDESDSFYSLWNGLISLCVSGEYFSMTLTTYKDSARTTKIKSKTWTKCQVITAPDVSFDEDNDNPAELTIEITQDTPLSESKWK